MSTPNPGEGQKGYEIPCELFEVSTFDVSSALPPENLAGVPVGGFQNAMTMLPSSAFDVCDKAARNGAEVFTFSIDIPPGVSDAEAQAFAIELVGKVARASRQSAGNGLRIEQLIVTSENAVSGRAPRRGLVKLTVVRG
jgi:hypothetical protein